MPPPPRRPLHPSFPSTSRVSIVTSLDCRVFDDAIKLDPCPYFIPDVYEIGLETTRQWPGFLRTAWRLLQSSVP